MLTRKQQWRRTRVRPARVCAGNDPATASSSADKKMKAAANLEGHERADSDQTTLSSWGSFDSSLDEGEDGQDSCSEVPLARAAPAAAERSVSFQQEVQVFLVTHKSELDTSAKQALWWTGRDAAINKRAWLHHLGQPGCGRQSAGRTRPKHQHLRQQHQHYQQHHHQDRSAHFLGAGRNTAAGRGRGGGALFAHNNNGSAFEVEEEDEAPVDTTEPLPAGGVGILGCRCDACLTEGDEHELDHEQQERLRRQRWRQEEREEQLPPRYAKHPPPPPPYNDQPPPRYNEAYSRPTGARSRGPSQQSRAARAASKSWPSPKDWDREDDLGGKGSRSYSPGSAWGSSPLFEACETYDGEGSYFFDR
eukprot:g10130.t1